MTSVRMAQSSNDSHLSKGREEDHETPVPQLNNLVCGAPYSNAFAVKYAPGQFPRVPVANVEQGHLDGKTTLTTSALTSGV